MIAAKKKCSEIDPPVVYPLHDLYPPEAALKTFITFDGATIAYHDEGEGSPVILLHGYGVDGLGQFGNFERILPLL